MPAGSPKETAKSLQVGRSRSSINNMYSQLSLSSPHLQLLRALVPGARGVSPASWGSSAQRTKDGVQSSAAAEDGAGRDSALCPSPPAILDSVGVREGVCKNSSVETSWLAEIQSKGGSHESHKASCMIEESIGQRID